MVRGLTGSEWDGKSCIETSIFDRAGNPYRTQIMMISSESEVPQAGAQFSIALDTTVSERLPEGSVIVVRENRRGPDYFHLIQAFPFRNPEAVSEWRSNVASSRQGERPNIECVESSNGLAASTLVQRTSPTISFREVNRPGVHRLDASISCLRAILDAGTIPTVLDSQVRSLQASGSVDPLEGISRHIAYLASQDPPGLPKIARPEWALELQSASAYAETLLMKLVAREGTGFDGLLDLDIDTLDGDASSKSCLRFTQELTRRGRYAEAARKLTKRWNVIWGLKEPSPFVSALLFAAALEGGLVRELLVHGLVAVDFMTEYGETAARLAAAIRQRISSLDRLDLDGPSLSALTAVALRLDDPRLSEVALGVLIQHRSIAGTLAILEYATLQDDVVTQAVNKLAKTGDLRLGEFILQRFSTDGQALQIYAEALSNSDEGSEKLSAIIVAILDHAEAGSRFLTTLTDRCRMGMSNAIWRTIEICLYRGDLDAVAPLIHACAHSPAFFAIVPLVARWARSREPKDRGRFVSMLVDGGIEILDRNLEGSRGSAWTVLFACIWLGDVENSVKIATAWPAVPPGWSWLDAIRPLEELIWYLWCGPLDGDSRFEMPPILSADVLGEVISRLIARESPLALTLIGLAAWHRFVRQRNLFNPAALRRLFYFRFRDVDRYEVGLTPVVMLLGTRDDKDRARLVQSLGGGFVEVAGRVDELVGAISGGHYYDVKMPRQLDAFSDESGFGIDDLGVTHIMLLHMLFDADEMLMPQAGDVCSMAAETCCSIVSIVGARTRPIRSLSSSAVLSISVIFVSPTGSARHGMERRRCLPRCW